MAIPRVSLTAEVDPDLRRRVVIAAERRERSVSDWVEEAVRRELECEEVDDDEFSRASMAVFARDWNSDEDALYDELVG